MANSAAVNAGDTATATQYNNLRNDVLDAATGHHHAGGTDGRPVPPSGLDPAGSLAGQVPVSTGSGTAPAWANVGMLGICGDGSDGDVTISADTTLIRDMYYNSLTVNSTKRLNTAGFRIFVKGSLTNNGFISNNGANGSATTSISAGAAAGTVGGGGQGAGGRTTAGAGAAGTGTTASLGGSGGAGGTQAGAGGAGGVAAVPTAPQGTCRDVGSAVRMLLMDGVKATGGGGGGAGGAGGTGPTTGSGGGGGGVLVVVALTIINTSGVIEANGGDGGDTVNSLASGGGGGGGGVCVILSQSLAAGTERANGGTGGACNGVEYPDATAGIPGTAGLVLKLNG